MNIKIRDADGLMAWTLVIGIFVLLGAGAWGWVWNIVKLAHADFVWTGLQILRIIGIFVPPLGAVLGFV